MQPSVLKPAVARRRLRRRQVLALVLAAVAAAGLSSHWYSLNAQHSKAQALKPCLASSRPWFESVTRAALAAPWTTRVSFNSTARIPQQLWQTSRSKQLGERAQQLHQTWRDLNPGMPATLLDDAAAAAFVRRFYGAAVYRIYKAYPLGVMRADFFRYAVLYARGGIYADVDTECLQPVARWFPPRAQNASLGRVFVRNGTWQAPGPVQYLNLTWDDCSFVAALENDADMCQWVIASAPGHPILRSVLRVVLDSVQSGLDCQDPHMVHVLTGPAAWTVGIRQALHLPANTTAAGIARAVWTNSTVYAAARQLRACFVAADLFGQVGDTPAQNVRNLYSSQWGDEDGPNSPWTLAREQLEAELKASTAGRSRQ